MLLLFWVQGGSSHSIVSVGCIILDDWCWASASLFCSTSRENLQPLLWVIGVGMLVYRFVHVFHNAHNTLLIEWKNESHSILLLHEAHFLDGKFGSFELLLFTRQGLYCCTMLLHFVQVCHPCNIDVKPLFARLWSFSFIWWYRRRTHGMYLYEYIYHCHFYVAHLEYILLLNRKDTIMALFHWYERTNTKSKQASPTLLAVVVI